LTHLFVMAGLVPAIHALAAVEDVDGRDIRAFTPVFDRPAMTERGRILINAVGKRGSLNVRFAPIATELLRRHEMPQWAKLRHPPTPNTFGVANCRKTIYR
jgi:hypothetical protein